MAQQTLIQKAQVFIRNFKLSRGGELVAAVSIFSHSVADKFGNLVLHGADGNLNLSLAAGKVIKGATQAFRNALQIVTDSSPLTTNSIPCNALGLDDIQYLTPAGTIAALTYVFPSDANSQLGQIIEITSTQIVSTLTITSTSLTLKGTAVTALAVNTPVRWRKVAASTWMRLA